MAISTTGRLPIIRATYLKFRPIILLIGMLLIARSAPVGAQVNLEADQYYTHFAFDGLRHPIFCGRLDSATGSPRSYGVRLDSLERPEVIYRYFFGNLDSRGDWAIMRFSYDPTPSGGMIVTRTWHLPNGEPIQIGPGYGEQTLFDSTGDLLLLQAIDRGGDRVERINGVTRQLFRRTDDGAVLQEWRYANNKQYHGGEPDPWNTQVETLGEGAWFRRLTLDSDNFVETEYPIGLDLRPMLFPEGVEMKRYDRNECGMPVAIEYQTREGKPMADYRGVVRITFTYNDRNQLLSWSAYDADGNLTPYSDGAARVEREYRPFDGKLMAVSRYDEGGELIDRTINPR